MLICGIESARLKLKHASRHLATLTATVNEFANGGHLHCDVRWDQNHPIYTCHIVVKAAAPVPDLIALQAGDVLGNLRAALDHAVYTHVVNNGPRLNDADKRRVSFPILEDEKKLPHSQQFGREVAEVIENHQPHRREKPSEHPLWQLNKLVNPDKHRVVLVTNSAMLEFSPKHDERLEPVRNASPTEVPLKPGEEIITWEFQATRKSSTRTTLFSARSAIQFRLISPTLTFTYRSFRP